MRFFLIVCLFFFSVKSLSQEKFYNIDEIDEYPIFKVDDQKIVSSNKNTFYRKFRLYIINNLEKKSLAKLIQKEKAFLKINITSDQVSIEAVSLKDSSIKNALQVIFDKLNVFQSAKIKDKNVSLSFVLLLKFKKKKSKPRRRSRRYY